MITLFNLNFYAIDPCGRRGYEPKSVILETHIQGRYIKHFLLNIPRVCATGPHSWLDNVVRAWNNFSFFIMKTHLRKPESISCPLIYVEQAFLI